MIQLFKDKSLKNNTKTGQGADARGAGVGSSVQSAGVQDASARGADNKNAKKQRGRSMVEMLGVLAIIGVLSIGGIQGYTMAMRRYRANEILNIVNKYAMLVYTSCQQQMINDPLVMQSDSTWPERGAGILHNDYLNKDFWYCKRVLFTDSGLGPLPQGVRAIGTLDPGDDSPVVFSGSLTVRIMSFSSGDVISVPLLLEDKSLCETIVGITGETRASDTDIHADDNLCTFGWGDNSAYYVLDPVNVIVN